METPAIASFEHVSVQERVVGDVRWIAIRARGAEWSWLTPQEAAELAHEWKELAVPPAETSSRAPSPANA